MLWAGLASLGFGFGDLAGGIATRRMPVRLVVVYSQIIGLVVVLAVAPVLGPNQPSPADFAWGAGAGLLGVAGITLLYDGLARGRMAVVSPAAAVAGVVAPALFGLITGERLSMLGWFGLAVALPAVALIATGSDDHRSTLPNGGLLWGIGSGLFFGGFLILISETSDEAGMWPLVAARLASVVALCLIITTRGEWQPVAKGAGLMVATAGILDIFANGFFVLASRAGPLSVVSVIAGLYPAATVLGARVVLGEQVSRRQVIGLALAGLAVIALSVAE